MVACGHEQEGNGPIRRTPEVKTGHRFGISDLNYILLGPGTAISRRERHITFLAL